MNKYGAIAEKHWRRWLPAQYRRLENPSSYFSTLGEDIQARIQEVELELAGDDPPGETYMQKLGRLEMARLNAEEQVLKEMALVEPEAETL